MGFARWLVGGGGEEDRKVRLQHGGMLSMNKFAVNCVKTLAMPKRVTETSQNICETILH